jgi:hypothetical protein
VWYLTIITLCFEASISLWLSSLGLSVIIGVALLLATKQNNVKQDPWVRYRLFIFPFCVSSYSALIKDQGFILVFPTNMTHLILATLSVILFQVIIKWLKSSFLET